MIEIPEKQIAIAGTEFVTTKSGFTSGGQASLCEAVFKKSDHSRRFLVKHFYENGETDEALYESEALAQTAAANHHQAVLASVLYDRATRTSVMLKASSDCKTLQELMREWENIPPEDLGSDYYDMGRLLESIRIVKSLLGALDGIHNDEKEPMLHMDLSPSNIMWGRNKAHGTAYLIDFGCCVKRGHKVDDRRRTTLSFAAPETGIPGVYLTPAADIYSVGAVFLLLVAGATAASNPPEEEKWSIRELPGSGNLNVTEPIDDLEIPDAYKGKLSEIIIKATTSVDKRYQSDSEMLADMVELEKIIAGRGMTPETLIRGSASLFRKECDNENGIFYYELQDDLVTDAVDFGSKTPVDILTQNTILLGSGGSGKTTKIRKLWEKCLASWKADPQNSPIPVFVPLNTFDSRQSNWDFFIRDYITTVYFPDLSMDVSQRRADFIGMLESTGKYVLFLDGINEAVDSSMLNAEVAKLAAFKNVTVIITSRNDWGDDETKKLFSTAETMPLNDDLIIQKLREKELGSPSARLLETLRRPMFLAMYLKLKITDQKVETPGQILQEHHKHLLAAYETGHHGDEWKTIVTTALDKILPQLSSQIKKMRFSEEELGNILSTLLNKYKSSMVFEQVETYLNSRGIPVRKSILTVLQNCGIIQNCGAEQYAFSHQNYLEFYQALDVFNQMAAFKNETNLPEALSAGVLPDAVMCFLGDILGEYAYWSKVNCDEPPSPVEEWLQHNCAGRKGREAQMVVRNLVEVMKYARGLEVTANYSGLDLTLTNFYGCVLVNSLFCGAILTQATFHYSGHQRVVTQTAALENKGYLVTASCFEKQLCIWDIATRQLVTQIPCSGKVEKFDISLDEKFVAVDEKLDFFSHQISVYSLDTGLKINTWKWEVIFPELLDPLGQEVSLMYFVSDNCTLIVGTTENSFNTLCFLDLFDREQIIQMECTPHFPVRFPVTIDRIPAKNGMTDVRYSLTVSADRRYLYCVSQTGEFKKWNLTKREREGAAIAFNVAVEDSFAMPSGNNIILRTDTNKLVRGDIYTGKTEQLLQLRSDPQNIAVANGAIFWNKWSEDYEDGRIFGWDIQNKQEFAFHSVMRSFSFGVSRSGSKLLAATGGRIVVFDIDTKTVTDTLYCSNKWEQPGKILSWNRTGLFIQKNFEEIYCIANKQIQYCPFPLGVFNNIDDDLYIVAELRDQLEGIISIYDTSTRKRIMQVPLQAEWAAYEWNMVYNPPSLLGLQLPAQSGFEWIKLDRKTGRVVICFRFAEKDRPELLWAWDGYTQTWRSIGDWTDPNIGTKEDCWSLFDEKNLTVETRCFTIDSLYVIGMTDGRLQFWTSDGECRGDFCVHKTSIRNIYAVPNSTYLITEDENDLRCVWNRDQEIRLVDSDCCYVYEEGIILPSISAVNFKNVLGIFEKETGRSTFIKPLDTKKQGRSLDICSDSLNHIILYGYKECEFKTWSRSVLSNDARIAVFTHDEDICIYNTTTLELKGRVDIREKVDAGISVMSVLLSPNTEHLAVEYSEGSITIYNLDGREVFCWEAISARDVFNCRFSGVEMSKKLEVLLTQNGVIVDSPQIMSITEN